MTEEVAAEGFWKECWQDGEGPKGAAEREAEVETVVGGHRRSGQRGWGERPAKGVGFLPRCCSGMGACGGAGWIPRKLLGTGALSSGSRDTESWTQELPDEQFYFLKIFYSRKGALGKQIHKHKPNREADPVGRPA